MLRITLILLTIVKLTLTNEHDHEFDSYKAIRSLHTKLDVDADGEVDDFESKKFLESDKNALFSTQTGTSDNSNRAKLRYLHQDGKDKSISVDELWDAWQASQVYNWTVAETIHWLVDSVELPEYSELFEKNSINGTLLPRLATDIHYITKLGITDSSAKSKISIKAMDVVLFGPPKSYSNHSKIRDIILSIVILVAISLCLIFHSRSRASQKALEAMQDDLESLQKAEDQMIELQQELNKAHKAMDAVSTEKKEPLRTLLQRTYNIESQHYNERKQNLENQVAEAKLRNQKLQRKKATFLGYYKMAQENSLEEGLNAIAEVKEAIMQVTREIKEHTERWRAIEELCGCSLSLRKQ